MLEVVGLGGASHLLWVPHPPLSGRTSPTPGCFWSESAKGTPDLQVLGSDPVLSSLLIKPWKRYLTFLTPSFLIFN